MIRGDETTAIGRNAGALAASINRASQLLPKIPRPEDYALSLFGSTIWAAVRYVPCPGLVDEETIKTGLHTAPFIVSWAVSLGPGGSVSNYARIDPTRLFKFVVQLPSIRGALKRRRSATLTLKLLEGEESYYLGACVDGQPVTEDDALKPPPIPVPVPNSNAILDRLSFRISVTTDQDSIMQDRKATPPGAPAAAPARPNLEHGLADDDGDDGSASETTDAPGSLDQEDTKPVLAALTSKNPRKRPAPSDLEAPPSGKSRPPRPLSRPEASLRPKASAAVAAVPPPPPPPPVVHYAAPASAPPAPAPVFPDPPRKIVNGFVTEILGIPVRSPIKSTSTRVDKAERTFRNLSSWKALHERPEYLTLATYEATFGTHYSLHDVTAWCAMNADRKNKCYSHYVFQLKGPGLCVSL
ncbi:hypothetical protein BOTBODRAFT_28354 [Botryobasidium botryosum FD-172 SS1]|uniref:Uncharacterized protein n=1 Tax=Botryobasidium botryosum (strain FD-172 SS1) TaxID=930990 RepID=A0A067MTG3_BOTB1|nr:hypothetical protein BOTBODRAFT_28354 [Botryobasidium botryosum FD-172 SS1]